VIIRLRILEILVIAGILNICLRLVPVATCFVFIIFLQIITYIYTFILIDDNMKIKSLTFFLTCFLMSAFMSVAQEQDANHGLKHWMTQEEAANRHLIGRDFVVTDPPPGIIRNVEEFGPTESVLIRYPFGLPMSLIKEMAKDCKVVTIVANASQQATVNSQYVSNGVNTANCLYLIAPTDTYWTRDYGPWYVTYGDNQVGIVDFPYNRPRPNDDEIPKKVAQMQGIEWFGMEVTHTGGNYMTDGLHQSSSTTLVWEENTDLTHEEIAQRMHDYLGIDNYMVVEDPNNTYIDHIDCWGKFLGPDKVLIRKVPPTHPQYSEIEATAAYYAAQISSYGTPFRVYRVNTPNNEPYTNAYILNNKVFIPYMGTMNDAGALIAYTQAMPGYQVTGYLGLTGEPWESTDAMHCRTHEMADRGMLYIEHIPLTGLVSAQPFFTIQADITAYSQQAIYSDSVWVIYRVNSGTYDTLPMVNTSANHYVGYIPGQLEGSTISYYIHAEDASGRSASHPFIGAPDPHKFEIAVSVNPDVTVYPDTLFFNTFEDMFFGKTAHVRNYTLQPVNIDYVDSEGGSSFLWYVDPWTISLPHVMASADSLDLTVKIAIPVSKTDYSCDSMMIITTNGQHKVAICVNSELLTEIKEPIPNNSVRCYPNPASSCVDFEFFADQGCDIKIDIYSSYGNRVKSLRSSSSGPGNNIIRWNTNDQNDRELASGIYFYHLMAGEKEFFGKITVLR
jgi:agmatine/peptidylarginine deiminase